jgi:hypothetical protein
MTAANPFVAAMAAHGWKAAGDDWARLALHCRDRAKASWAECSRCLSVAESEFTELAKSIDADRDDPEWSAIENEIRAELETKGSAAQ